MVGCASRNLHYRLPGLTVVVVALSEPQKKKTATCANRYQDHQQRTVINVIVFGPHLASICVVCRRKTVKITYRSHIIAKNSLVTSTRVLDRFSISLCRKRVKNWPHDRQLLSDRVSVPSFTHAFPAFRNHEYKIEKVVHAIGAIAAAAIEPFKPHAALQIAGKSWFTKPQWPSGLLHRKSQVSLPDPESILRLFLPKSFNSSRFITGNDMIQTCIPIY